jgi:hypothetical protein
LALCKTLDGKASMLMGTNARTWLLIDRYSVRHISLNWSRTASDGYNVLCLLLRLYKAWTLD